jgi:peroxiredoxin Q/BCP
MIELKIGDKAPEINSVDQNGNQITLNQYKGKKVVLYFYPKDMTPGCTAQSCNLSDNYKLLQKSGYDVIGVSCDSIKRHQKFIEKYSLPFNLVSDEDQKVVNDYGVWQLKKFMGREYMGIMRTTFLIDENGIIEEIITKVNTKEHTTQIIK